MLSEGSLAILARLNVVDFFPDFELFRAIFDVSAIMKTSAERDLYLDCTSLSFYLIFDDCSQDSSNSEASFGRILR